MPTTPSEAIQVLDDVQAPVDTISSSASESPCGEDAEWTHLHRIRVSIAKGALGRLGIQKCVGGLSSMPSVYRVVRKHIIHVCGTMDPEVYMRANNLPLESCWLTFLVDDMFGCKMIQCLYAEVCLQRRALRIQAGTLTTIHAIYLLLHDLEIDPANEHRRAQNLLLAEEVWNILVTDNMVDVELYPVILAGASRELASNTDLWNLLTWLTHQALGDMRNYQLGDHLSGCACEKRMLILTHQQGGKLPASFPKLRQCLRLYGMQFW
eukprot:5949544-Amphidinium_carterae.1